jgi:hypothetical protein
MPGFEGVIYDLDFLAQNRWAQVEFRGSNQQPAGLVAVSDNPQLLCFLEIAFSLQLQLNVTYDNSAPGVNRLLAASIDDLPQAHLKSLKFDVESCRLSTEFSQLGAQNPVGIFTSDAMAQGILLTLIALGKCPLPASQLLSVDVEPAKGGEITRAHLNIRSSAKQRQLRVSASAITTWYAACESGHPFWSGPDENTYSDAQKDASGHDNSIHGGVPTAVALNNQVRGGGGTITKLGPDGRIGLTVSAVGNTETFNISDATTVQFEMYLPLATVPCGAWTFAGRGSFQQILGGNLLGCDPPVGEQCTITAFAQSGKVPVYVTANP